MKTIQLTDEEAKMLHRELSVNVDWLSSKFRGADFLGLTKEEKDRIEKTINLSKSILEKL